MQNKHLKWSLYWILFNILAFAGKSKIPIWRFMYYFESKVNSHNFIKRFKILVQEIFSIWLFSWSPWPYMALSGTRVSCFTRLTICAALRYQCWFFLSLTAQEDFQVLNCLGFLKTKVITITLKRLLNNKRFSHFKICLIISLL